MRFWSYTGSPTVDQVTIRGCSLPIGPKDLCDRFGPFEELRDLEHHPEGQRVPFPWLPGDAYYFRKANIRFEMWGGPDNGEILSGDQLEVRGLVVARAGSPDSDIEKVFGEESCRLCYTLKGRRRPHRDYLILRLDQRGLIERFELHCSNSVD